MIEITGTWAKSGLSSSRAVYPLNELNESCVATTPCGDVVAPTFGNHTYVCRPEIYWGDALRSSSPLLATKEAMAPARLKIRNQGPRCAITDNFSYGRPLTTSAKTSRSRGITGIERSTLIDAKPSRPKQNHTRRVEAGWIRTDTYETQLETLPWNGYSP